MLKSTGIYEKITGDVRVTALPVYMEQESMPDKHSYTWAYIINIANLGDKDIQLVNRHWQITNARGHIEEVKGSGVVGEQPIIKAGSMFEYTSGTTLTTPSGFMGGSYNMLKGNDMFSVEIPTFALDTADKITIN